MNKKYRRTIYFLLALALAISPTPFILADEKTEYPPGITGELPPGMEIIKVGSADVVVPKGTRVYKDGTVLTIESIEQYAGRRFLEVEENFSNVESELNNLKNEIQQLKDILKLNIEKRILQNETYQKNIKKEISRLKEDMNETVWHISGLESKQKSVNENIEEVKKGILKITTQLSQLEEKQKRIEKAIKLIQLIPQIQKSKKEEKIKSLR